MTKNGEDVAVKRLRDGNQDIEYRHAQFRNEFYNLTKVKHKNIVQFLGYCYEIEHTNIEYDGKIVIVEKIHRALCFEYLHNGSLQNHLSGMLICSIFSSMEKYVPRYFCNFFEKMYFCM